MSESPADLTVTPLGAGRFLLSRNEEQRVAYATHAGGATWVFLDGDVAVIAPAASHARTAAADDHASLAAPMPATVVAIAVQPGQRVSTGDVLIRLEAMKMELPIRSPRDGTVIAIKCREGELVQPGVPLLELDEA
jgi:biotin carboxyl carrier protein